jgi:hypothetical protein
LDTPSVSRDSYNKCLQRAEFFYNPDNSLPKGIYFATIKESDGPNDKASNLDREGVFRLSIGIGKKNYQSLFGGHFLSKCDF